MDKPIRKLPGTTGLPPSISWTDADTGDTYEVSFVEGGLEVVMPGGFPVVLPAGLIRHFLAQHLHALLRKAADNSSPEAIESFFQMAMSMTNS